MASDGLDAWVGRREVIDDCVTCAPVSGLSAALDRSDPAPALGDELPPLWRWLYFLPRHRQSEIGVDGHARRGGFLPPVALPRRMWAGGRFGFDRRALAAFEFRATGPLLDISPFSVCGAPAEAADGAELWARAADGALAMEAKALFTNRVAPT